MELKWQEVNTEHIVRDEWIDFRRSVYRFPDGREIGPFYTYSRRDYVVIVALDEESRYICVRQFRQGIRKVTTEFPAGGLERTDGLQYRDPYGDAPTEKDGAEDPGSEASENALEAAKRELLEETGYISEKWTHLITIPSNATISDNYAHVYMAENCRKVAGQHLDETEFLNVTLHSEAEIQEMIRTGGFQQSVHVMAWLLAKEKTVQSK